MMPPGSLTLADVANHTAVLAVACSRCERTGRYSLATLIARHGVQFAIPDLLRELSADFPRRQSVSAYDLCGGALPRATAAVSIKKYLATKQHRYHASEVARGLE
jgi:hypothetical protein